MTSAFSALALATALAASPTTTLAQTAAPTAQAPAAAAPAPTGLPIAAVVDWLKAQGLTVGEVQGGDQPYVQIRESGDLAWTVTFNSCDHQVCGDLQFGAGFSNPQVTLDKVNAWNRDNRYLKAFHTAAETPTATVQYDVVVLSGGGVEQLADPLAVWLQLLPKFAGEMGYVAPQ